MIGDPASTAPLSLARARAYPLVPRVRNGRASQPRRPSSSLARCRYPRGEMSSLPDTTHRSLPGGQPRDVRADPYLKSMLLGLIEDSYLHTGTFTQFAAEVLQVIAYAVTVPVAFTEGFLKAYLSIDRVVEDDDGRIKIIPKAGATIEDMIRDVDEITAQVDPGAVFNPVVRAKLDAVHETSEQGDEVGHQHAVADGRRAAHGGPARDAGRVRGGARAGRGTTRPPTTCAPRSPRSAATCASSRPAIRRDRGRAGRRRSSPALIRGPAAPRPAPVRGLTHRGPLDT